MVFNPQGSVRLDTPAACDPVSRPGTKTLDLSIPTNLGPGSEMLRTVLDDPTAGRMRGDVEVQDTTPVMANDEKAVEQVESDGGDSKEVHGGNGFAMIVKNTKTKASQVQDFWVRGASSGRSY